MHDSLHAAASIQYQRQVAKGITNYCCSSQLQLLGLQIRTVPTAASCCAASWALIEDLPQQPTCEQQLQWSLQTAAQARLSWCHNYCCSLCTCCDSLTQRTGTAVCLAKAQPSVAVTVVSICPCMQSKQQSHCL